MKRIKDLSKWLLAAVMHSNSAVTESIKIREFEFKDNTMHIVAQHPEFANLADALVKFFEDSGGVNYVATDMYHPKLGFFEVTVQRKDGKTPAQLNVELKQRVAELEEKLRCYCV